MNRTLRQKLILAAITLVGIGFMVGYWEVSESNQTVAARDFAFYWTSADLFVRGANPYSYEPMRGLEWQPAQDKQLYAVMRNPPLVLLLIGPFAFFSPKTGLILWWLLMFGCVAWSYRMVWAMRGRPDDLAPLFLLCFAPLFACYMAAQSGVFLLLGLVLFLYLRERHPALAGAGLVLCALKPHLFFAFAVVFLAEQIRRRDYRIVAGFLVAFASACALVTLLAPHVWADYNQMMHQPRVQLERSPTLSVLLRTVVPGNPIWVEFIPCVVASVWALWYYLQQRNRWQWMDQGLLVLLVSVLCAPYSYFSDEALLLPAVLAGIDAALAARRPLWPLALIVVPTIAEVATSTQLTSNLYLWTKPAWLLWYLYATGRLHLPFGSRTRSQAPSAAA